MKKSLIALFACIVGSVANAASISNDDYQYTGSGSTLELTDIAAFSQDGDFALSFDLGRPLYESGKVDFLLQFGEGAGGSGVSLAFNIDADARQYVDMATWQFGDAPYGVYTFSPNGSTIIAPFESQITASHLLIQVKNLFEANPLVSISVYDDNETLTEIASATIQPNRYGELPESINLMNIRVTTQTIPAIETEGIGITTWKGEVTASDIQNPTYLEPSPSVPEPTSATLSLLALAGLAARRRRK